MTSLRVGVFMEDLDSFSNRQEGVECKFPRYPVGSVLRRSAIPAQNRKPNAGRRLYKGLLKPRHHIAAREIVNTGGNMTPKTVMVYSKTG